ncbi:lysozyme [Candidatus Woesearchaeota archaeon]|nr:lysozyme [Candidatus Woesearchaeota archaeon]
MSMEKRLKKELHNILSGLLSNIKILEDGYKDKYEAKNVRRYRVYTQLQRDALLKFTADYLEFLNFTETIEALPEINFEEQKMEMVSAHAGSVFQKFVEEYFPLLQADLDVEHLDLELAKKTTKKKEDELIRNLEFSFRSLLIEYLAIIRELGGHLEEKDREKMKKFFPTHRKFSIFGSVWKDLAAAGVMVALAVGLLNKENKVKKVEPTQVMKTISSGRKDVDFKEDAPKTKEENLRKRIKSAIKEKEEPKIEKEKEREPGKGSSGVLGIKNISGKGLSHIMKWEGFRSLAYRDVAGVWTIGFGHTGPEVKAGMRVSKNEGKRLLAKDIAWAEKAVRNYVKVPLTQGQFDALVSFVYNSGAKAFKDSTLLKKLNKGDYNEAYPELRRWIYAGGRKVKGLVNRRKAEIKLWNS